MFMPDWYWICGSQAYFYLHANWNGICALIHLSNPITIILSTPLVRSMRLLNFQARTNCHSSHHCTEQGSVLQIHATQR